MLLKIGITLFTVGTVLWVLLLSYAGSTPYQRRAIKLTKYAERWLAVGLCGNAFVLLQGLIWIWSK